MKTILQFISRLTSGKSSPVTVTRCELKQPKALKPEIGTKVKPVNLFVIRQVYTPTSTLGVLLIDSKVLCYTLEDVVRESSAPKVPGQTAIPAGRYEIVVDMSARFKRMMPLLLNVPNFEGVRLHGGNTSGDTEGCILVAYNKVDDSTIQGSAEAAITERLQDKQQHFIEIVDTFPYTGV